VRKLIAAAALLAVVLVLGCQDTKKVTELQGKVDQMTQQITDMNGQMAKLTATNDSLAKALADTTAKLHPVKGGTMTKQPAGGMKTGGTPAPAPKSTMKPTTKK